MTSATPLDPVICYRALTTRDARFDGRIFVAVTSTGIYCRPVCPARPAKAQNCRFYPSAAAAQHAGFRPCLRCRPETAPGLGRWNGTSTTVARGLALIADGALDGGDVEQLSERLGVGSRQLRRLFRQHLGASPAAVAQTRRVLFAKQLIHETHLPMTQIAFASGFQSVRRFNEVFHQLYGRPPSALRRSQSAREPANVEVRLRYRAPYDWPAMLGFLKLRAVPQIEHIGNGYYLRSIAIDGEHGSISVGHDANRQSLIATIIFPNLRSLPRIVARLRKLFDLDADALSICEHLAQDPFLAPQIATRPGQRVPQCWDGFELAMRAVLGQQVSMKAARNLVSILVRTCGTPIDGPVSHLFPGAGQVIGSNLDALTMPGARKRALKSIAAAYLDDPTLFDALDDVKATVTRLIAIPGVGDWTAQYIAMRASGEPDAFPSSDVGLLRGARANGVRPSPKELLKQAEHWRPWRAYAAQHLWASDAKGTQ